MPKASKADPLPVLPRQECSTKFHKGHIFNSGALSPGAEIFSVKNSAAF